jgi:hypothetical protein
MIQQPQLDFLKFQVKVLRDLHFLAKYADVPEEAEEPYNFIYDQIKTDAMEITKVLFPNHSVTEYELVRINGELMGTLSPMWWSLVDAALAEL